MIKSWDIWIRLFHWALALLVVFLIFSGLTGTGFFSWHKPAGEVVLALLLFRICWGVVGSSNARLSSLFSRPSEVVSHLSGLADGDIRQHRGHNPAGGWAVLIMLVLLLVQASTGFFIADEEEWVVGVFYGSVSGSLSSILYEIHHLNATLLQLIVFLHILMIPAYWLLAKQNLFTPMLTGRKKLAHGSHEDPEPTIKYGSFWIALVLLAISCGAVLLITGRFSLW